MSNMATAVLAEDETLLRQFLKKKLLSNKLKKKTKMFLHSCQSLIGVVLVDIWNKKPSLKKMFRIC